MKHKVLCLTLAWCTLILASCGSASYYSSTSYDDGIYYRPTPASRAVLVANNQEEAYQRSRTLESYFEVDSVTGRVYLADGVSYSDLLRKFDSPNYVFTLNTGGWYYDPWYNPWWGSWRFSWCDPWWGPVPYHPWYSHWYDPWYGPWYGPWHPYHWHGYWPDPYIANRNVVYGKRYENGSIGGGRTYSGGTAHRQAGSYISSGTSVTTGNRGIVTGRTSEGGSRTSSYSSGRATTSSRSTYTGDGGSRSRSSSYSGSSGRSAGSWGGSSGTSGGSRTGSSFGGGYSGGGSYGGSFGGSHSSGGGSRSGGGGRR